MSNWKDSLQEDEVALLGHSPLTDLLIYRIAYNRKMAIQFSDRLKKTGGWYKSEQLTDRDRELANQCVRELEADPEYIESTKRRAECHARGGCSWGSIQAESDRIPYVECSNCHSSITAYQLPLQRPEV
jgi:hypothetical protein